MRLLQWIEKHSSVLDLSRELRVSPQAIYGWLRGRTPTMRHIRLIEDVTKRAVTASDWAKEANT